MKINFGIIKTKYQKASVCVTIRSLAKKASLKSAKIILIFHHKPYLQVNLKKKKLTAGYSLGIAFSSLHLRDQPYRQREKGFYQNIL